MLVVDFLSSFGLAGVLFIFLLILTFLGTLEQGESGLYETQKKYFESFFLVHMLFDRVPILLPGAYLLMSLLSLNILIGGILRLRRGWRQVGVFIAHMGIIMLLAGGLVTYHYSSNGHMTLYENESSNIVQSYNEWELALSKLNNDGTMTEMVVPEEQFGDLEGDKTAVYRSESLPFTITLSSFLENTRPKPKGPMFEAPTKVVDGFFLEPLPRDAENERNAAGLYATVEEKDSGQTHELMLWGLQRTPVKIDIAGSTWLVDLRRKQWQVPFTVTLDKFTRELHPRTNMPAMFASDITKSEGGVDQKINISMNAPLRHRGYTFFQASWGPQNAGPNDSLFSTFAVVRNPADKIPLYSCIVITLGMLIHYLLKLVSYLRTENKRRS